MKKTLAFLFSLLTVFALFVLSSSAATSAVFDRADLLTEEEEAQLNRDFSAYTQRTGNSVLVITEEDSDDSDYYYRLQNYYNVNKESIGEDVILFGVRMSDRSYSFFCHGIFYDGLTDYQWDYIEATFASGLRSGDYYRAFDSAFRAASSVVESGDDAIPDDFVSPYGDSDRSLSFNPAAGWVGRGFLSLLIGLIISLISNAAEKKKLTSVSSVNQANDYVVAGSLNVVGQNERFLYNTVSRVRIDSDSSRSGGGGSHGGSFGGSSASGGGRSGHF